MGSRAGSSGVNGSSRVGGHGTEEENHNTETHASCLKAVRPRLGSADPAGQGRSSSAEHLMRPALPGRKSHKKTFGDVNRGRWKEGNQETDEERNNVEHVESRDRGKQRQRKTERAETHGDGAQERQGTGSPESLSRSNSWEVREGSNNLPRGHTCPRPLSIGYSQTNTISLNAQSPRPALRSMSSQPTIQSRSTRLSPQGRPAGDLHRFPFSSSSNLDPFWVEVRTGGATGRSGPSHHGSELGAEEEGEVDGEEEEEEEEEEEDVENAEEEGSGVMEVMGRTMTPAAVPPCVSTAERRMSKREKNRIKCLRRRQRRRERWRQSQLQESTQSSTGNPSSSSSEDEEDMSAGDREGYICAVCLDVYFSPYMCHPCNHIFCEPCLRTLAKSSPTNTPCPLCRTIITHVFFQKGFQRPSSPIARRQFPHGGGYRLDAMDFEDDSRGWRFDMDLVIVYIYSVNWVIGFFIFCFLCYLFFPSF
ncbi:hypothetical protein F2P81_014065 [Scophthalmus maximus]|uniref:RING-type domain-containing protein n=1 Tax=Scophthalmus maximus TaxID=52904 RepID=A0A6A4SMX2_SCOMX|nr:hypothetical protein F2P81_014065 [Scophthalmus maximus]